MTEVTQLRQLQTNSKLDTDVVMILSSIIPNLMKHNKIFFT